MFNKIFNKANILLLSFLLCVPFVFVFSAYSTDNKYFNVFEYCENNMDETTNAIGFEFQDVTPGDTHFLNESSFEYYQTPNMLYGGFAAPFLSYKDFKIGFSLKTIPNIKVDVESSLVSAFIRDDLWNYQCSIPNVVENSNKSFEKLLEPIDDNLYNIYLNEQLLDYLCANFGVSRDGIIGKTLEVRMNNNNVDFVFEFAISGCFKTQNDGKDVNRFLFNNFYFIVHQSFFDNEILNYSRMALQIFENEKTNKFRREFLSYSQSFLNNVGEKIAMFPYSNDKKTNEDLSLMINSDLQFKNSRNKNFANIILVIVGILSLLLLFLALFFQKRKSIIATVVFCTISIVYFFANLFVFSRLITSIELFNYKICLLSPNASALCFVYLLLITLICLFSFCLRKMLSKQHCNNQPLK